MQVLLRGLLWGLVLAASAVPVRAQRNQHVPAPPLLQVAQAEQPVQLRSVHVDGHAAGGLAQTVVELEFFNPNARQLEGQLAFPLLDGQQVAGFALDIQGQMRDAVPVPKDKGRQVFEAIERRQVDPGLVEQTAGNQFRLRVYPIPAQGSRRVRLTLRESLPRQTDGWQWRVPLQFAAGARQVTLNFSVQGAAPSPPRGQSLLTFSPRDGAQRAAWSGAASRLPAVLTLQLPQASAPLLSRGEYQGERYFMAQLRLDDLRGQRPLPQRVGLLWDASASAVKRDLPAEFVVLNRYFAAAGTMEVELTVLRDRAEPVQRFTVKNGDWSALRRHLQTLPADGASALGAWQPQRGVQEYLLVSDGLVSYGERQLPALLPGQRLYAINSAAAADRDWLDAVTQANGGRRVDCVEPAQLERAVSQLLQRSGELVSLRGEGVADLVADTRFADDGFVRVSGRLLSDNAQVRLRVATQSSVREVGLSLRDATPVAGDMVAAAWARARLRELGAAPAANAATIRELSMRFGVVSADTSLIVLEDLADYLRYDITPPAELRAAFASAQGARRQQRDTARGQRIDHVAGEFAKRIAWWNTRWPKDPPVSTLPADGMEVVRAPAPMAVLAAPPPPVQAMMAESADSALQDAASDNRASRSQQRSVPASSSVSAKQASAAPQAVIALTLQAWQPDSPYAKRLRAAPADAVYALYLGERAAHAGSSAFYLDVADILFERGQPLLAARVLSNLAELDLGNRHVLRVLGYRLMQAGLAQQAVPVFREVLALGEEEPQSFRDLGLALAATGERQAAIASLYEVVARDWDHRFDGIALIALDELNTIVARSPTPLQTGFVDKRLLKPLPLDLRVVLSWDSDNSDMDLWVTDPNGERAYYGNRHTFQGGELSQDFTGGYGPEQFSLRTAKPGRYKVEANFFGDRQQLVTGATTLSLWLSTHWGSRNQHDQQVTLRLKDRAETILVGEFEVR